MANISQYRQALAQAQSQGDQEAVEYFTQQLAQVGATPHTDVATGEKGSFFDPLAQGVSFGFADEIGGGIHGLYNMATGKGTFGEGYDATTESMREKLSSYRERNPYVSTGVEIASALAMPLGAMKTGASGLKAALGSGALYGTGSADAEDKRLEGALTGAAAGGITHGLLKGGGSLLKGTLGKASQRSRQPDYKRDVALLEKTGIKPTSAEAINNANARQSQEALRRAFHNEDNRPQQLYSKLMGMVSDPKKGRAHGFDPDDVAEGALSRGAVERAKQRFSAAYEDIFQDTSVDRGQLMQRIAPVRKKLDDLLPFEKGNGTKIVQDFENYIKRQAPTARMSGKKYKQLRTNLNTKIERLRKSSEWNGLADVMRGLRDGLDEAFRASVPAAKRDALKRVDSSYGGFKELSKAAQNPEALGTFINSVKRNEHRLPKDFVNLADAYQNVLLRGYPRSSMTAEGMAFGDLPKILMHGLRSGTAKTSKAYEDLYSAARVPKGKPIGDKLSPLLSHAAERKGIIAGQQGQDSFAEELAKAFLPGG